MPNSVSATQQAIAARTLEWWRQLQEEHPEQQFYGLAFGFHDDFVGTSLWANSLDSITGNSVDEMDHEELWITPNWTHSLPLYDIWNELLLSGEEDGNDVDEECNHRRVQCIAGTIAALKELADAGEWGTGESQVLVFLSMWDGFMSDWLMHESARRIQPNGASPLFPIENEFRFDDVIFRRFLRRQLREPHGEFIREFYRVIEEPLE